MKKMDAIFGVARVPLDALAVLAALLVSFWLRLERIDLLPGVQLLEPAQTFPSFAMYLSSFVVPGVLAYVILSALLGLYTFRSTLGAWNEIGRITTVIGLWIVFILARYALVLRELFFSRILLVHSALFMFLFVIGCRMALLIAERLLLKKGIGRIVVVSIGSQPLAAIAERTLIEDYHYTYAGHLHVLDELRQLADTQEIDLAIQTDPTPESDGTIRLIDYCRSAHIGYGFLPPVLADLPHMLQVERLGLLPLMRFQPTPLDGWGRVLKRLFDIVVSLLLIVLLSPFLLLIALIILITGGGPVFYVSSRVGQFGRGRIPVLKFRSMIQGADEQKETLLERNHRHDGPLFKMKNDPRVTPFGRFLRRFSLDELPQLFNILAGQMSLVGPRPHLPEEVDRYSPEQRRVFAVKPGLTGLAQIAGRSDLKFEEEVRLDLQYIEEWSIGLDLWVLWRTLAVVMSREGAD